MCKYGYMALQFCASKNLYYSTGSSSNRILNENGWNGTPSPIKCLLIASTQCSRKLCNMALRPSMTQSMKIVSTNHR